MKSISALFLDSVFHSIVMETLEVKHNICSNISLPQSLGVGMPQDIYKAMGVAGV